MCRKIAEVGDGGTIEVWGDGSAVRSYTYVSDMVDGIYLLMHSDLKGAVNIGCPQYVTVDELANTVAKVSEKKITIKHVKGPVEFNREIFRMSEYIRLVGNQKSILKTGLN